MAGWKPVARREGLVVKELGDEVLVYDLQRHQAHCLNRAAARVWSQCDGSRLDSQICPADGLSQAAQRDAVGLALAQLGRRHLLEGASPVPTGVSRRELMRRLGLASAAAVPLITTLVAPKAVQASSCLPSGSACTAAAQCCSGICSGGTCV
jgi:hypothetical protein